MKTAAENAGGLCTFFGGFPDAERRMMCVYPEYWQENDWEWPMAALRFPREFPFDHRHVLGTLMSLGITRECLGDISLDENEVQVIFVSRIKPLLENEFVRIKGRPIKRKFYDVSEIRSFEKKYKAINLVVSSPRLDAVIAHIWGMSRQDAAAAVRQGRVFLNYREMNKIDSRVASGDILSVRGKGKALIDDFGGETKKGRLRLTVKKYI